jgi:hypothetical protein
MGVAFDEVFDFAKDHFHEDGLRTGPTAPEPSKSRREYNDARDENQQRHRGDDHVLRPENLAEDDELAFDEVQQEQRVAVNANERPHEYDREQQPAQICPRTEESSALFARVKPLAMAFLVDRREMVAVVLPVNWLHRAFGLARLVAFFWRGGGHVKKLQAPTSKLQRSTKHQSSKQSARRRHSYWSLVLGISLELGAWNLELSFPYSNSLGPVLTGARFSGGLGFTRWVPRSV